MHKLVTPDGWAFNAQSFVKLGGEYYDLDEMSEAQQEYIGTMLNVQGLNAAFAGRATFQAEGLPPFREVFPEVAEKLEGEG